MLLTLDLASNVGWTLGAPADTHFKYGSVMVGPGDLGTIACRYDAWLLCIGNGVTDCVFEAPILPHRTSLAAVRLLHGLAWHTEFCCEHWGISVREVNLVKVKKFVTGSGRANKIEVMREVRRRGYDVANHDEADAVALRLYVLHQRFPELRGRFRLEMGTLGVAGG